MAPLAPRSGHGLLRCPICRCDFAAVAGVLICRNGHTFDIAREGYVNLIRGGRRTARGGDSREQLRHRAAFLAAGHFDAIDATIAEFLERDVAVSHENWRVLDSGCGTGYHLARLAAALKLPVVGLGLDLSKEAVRQAARYWPGLAFAVSDTWAEWPVRGAAADLVLSIFAPKNFRETARVLRPEGCFAVVYPGPCHLAELRLRFGLMEQQEDKSERYAAAVSRFIGPPRVTRLLHKATLDNAAIRDVILMGPNAHRVSASALAVETGPIAVTFDVVVLLARASQSR